MTCLSIIQEVSQRLNLASPTSSAQSTDPAVLQLVALANKEGEWMTDQCDWQVLTQEASFTTVATEIQGALDTICPGLKNVVNDTMWNRDLRRPVFGPTTNARWEQLKAMVMTGPWNMYEIRNNNIRFIPVPTAGQSIYFLYTTQYWCQSSTGTNQSRFLADTDVLLLREDLFKLGMEWRWKKAKGLDYAQDFADYEVMLESAKSRDGAKDTINMGDVKYDIYPGILVPSGSWPT